MEDLVRDVRQSLRIVLKERTFGGTVLLTLAICLGANVALFGVIHTVLLEPLPFRDPERLVTVYNSYPGAGAEESSNGSFDFFQRHFRSFTTWITLSPTVIPSSPKRTP